MVDTRKGNIMNTSSGPLTSENVSTVVHNDYRDRLMLDVDSLSIGWQHSTQMSVVSVVSYNIYCNAYPTQRIVERTQ
jgi:hypothetical protein